VEIDSGLVADEEIKIWNKTKKDKDKDKKEEN
jgi:hypothetical protein